MPRRICVVFIRNQMQVGGVENYVYTSVKKIVSNDDIAVWAAKNFDNISPSYEKLMCGNKVIRCSISSINNELKKIASINGNISFKLVAFNAHDFCRAELIKFKLTNNDISTFMFVPHFQGQFLYLEDGFSKDDKVKSMLSTIYQKMERNGNIRYFSERHLYEFRQRYGCKIENFSSVSVPVFSDYIKFDENRIRKVYDNEQFEILSVSRLEFPHKAYILGLVDDFNELCKKYKNLRLVIIGDGEGRTVLTNKIRSLHSEVREKIEIVGSVGPEELNNYYDKANVLISLAGSFSKGAHRGVLSLPARHYSEKCEVYGFLPNSKKYTLSEEKGEDVIPYIEKIINMSYEEYRLRCRECYDAYEDLNQNTLYYDKLINSSHQVISVWNAFYLERIFIHNKIKYIFSKAFKK